MSQKQQQVPLLLCSFSAIFYMCKICGIYPHDFRAFKEQTLLKRSPLGTGIVITVMIIVSVFFNLMIFSFEDTTFSSSQNNLDKLIGIVLTYIGLSMMITDQITALRNQSEIADIFESIQLVDEDLLEQNITVNNRRIELSIRFMIIWSAICEVTICSTTYWFLVDRTEWISLLWVFSCVPTFFNSLDKIWFVGVLRALQERFEAINLSLEDIVERHEQLKYLLNKNNEKRASSLKKKPMKNDKNLENALKLGSGKNKIVPIAAVNNFFGESIESLQKFPCMELNLNHDSELSNFTAIEEKLVNLCQLHDGICQIAKKLNVMWSYPMLILMAYGFLITIALMYFLYCAAENQEIPSLFRPAKMTFITMVYLKYITIKCISIMYCSWKTSLASKRTGICMHKCAVAADTNEIYEMVNHLSLKLLNHVLDFSACGFFSLDMETLFAVCGGITSYLIILIQFNMAGEQAKLAHSMPVENINKTEPFVWGLGNATSYLNYFMYFTSLSYV